MGHGVNPTLGVGFKHFWQYNVVRLLAIDPFYSPALHLEAFVLLVFHSDLPVVLPFCFCLQERVLEEMEILCKHHASRPQAILVSQTRRDP